MKPLRKLAVVVVLLSPMAANADIIYDFQGIDDATGFAVSGVLTLSDSFGSTPTRLEQFVSFVFSNESAQINRSFEAPDGDFLFEPPIDPALIVKSFAWEVRIDPFHYEIIIGDVFRQTGTSTSWTQRLPTAVPEPGTLALLTLGLAGIGLARRRNQLAWI